MSEIYELFLPEKGKIEKSDNRIIEIPTSQIVDFPNHPYRVNDDENMSELIESIKERGLLQPVIVRPIENGKYEMVSGHRRKRAYELAGIDTIPCRVLEMTRDEAIIIMVDSNLMRETILPSERAFAYKMRLDAMKRMPGRPSKENGSPVGNNFQMKSSELFSEQIGESKNQIYRYIRLTNLIPDLLNLVDEGRMKMRPAVEISYLSEDEQRDLLDAIDETDATPSHAQAIRLRKLSAEGSLTSETIRKIMYEAKPNQKEKSPFRDKRILEMIPKNISVEQHSDYVLCALDYYNRYLKRIRNRDER